MASDPRKPLVLLRGDQLAKGGSASSGTMHRQIQSPGVPTPLADGESIYGIPISAIQHCCGKGCKHCRVYWNRKKI